MAFEFERIKECEIHVPRINWSSSIFLKANSAIPYLSYVKWQKCSNFDKKQHFLDKCRQRILIECFDDSNLFVFLTFSETIAFGHNFGGYRFNS